MGVVSQVLFDIRNISSLEFLNSSFGFVFYFFIISFLLLLLTIKKSIRQFLQGMMNPGFFPVRLFLVMFSGFSFCMFIVTFNSYNDSVKEMKESLINGKGWITDGEIKGFVKNSYGGKAEVSFSVNKIRFNYSEDQLYPGYHDISGPLAEGLKVRIYYFHDQNSDIKNKITRLEILD
jgi:hypothetical protein